MSKTEPWCELIALFLAFYLQICARRPFAYEIYSKLFRYLLIFEAIIFINFELKAGRSPATVCGKVQRWPIVASGAHIFHSRTAEIRKPRYWKDDLRALRGWSAPSISVSTPTNLASSQSQASREAEQPLNRSFVNHLNNQAINSAANDARYQYRWGPTGPKNTLPCWLTVRKLDGKSLLHMHEMQITDPDPKLT